MASVKYTAFVNELKGKIAGTVFKKGYAGNSVQALSSKWIGDSGWKLTKADAGRLINPKLALSALSTGWKSLTEAQRLSWQSQVAENPFKNRFGESYIPSAFQLFISTNTILMNAGLAPVLTAPIGGVVPVIPQFHPIPGWPWYTFDWDDFTNNGYCTCEISATPPKPRADAPINVGMRVIKIVPAVHMAPINFLDDYIKYFGTAPTSGFVGVSVVAIDERSGKKSMPMYCMLRVPETI